MKDREPKQTQKRKVNSDKRQQEADRLARSYLRGEITNEQYVEEFDKKVSPINLRRAGQKLNIS